MSETPRYYPYGRQNIDDTDIDSVVQALKSGAITCGKRVNEFEAGLAAIVGAKYAVAVSNGTAALHIAYAAAGLVNGETVITSPLSFAATANAALYCGATPVFADVLPNGNIDPAAITTALLPSTRIIAPVHLAGQPADMRRIHEIADRNNLFIIEDACHALGAEYDGAPIGSCKYSDMAVFSFHPVKHITTGEGGAITTNNEGLYERLKLLRSHGIVTPEENWKKDMLLLGYNYRITDIQCALGSSQLRKLERFLQERRHIAALYTTLLEDNKYFEPVPCFEGGHAYHLYPVLLNTKTDRDVFMQKAQRAGIGLQVHYGLIYKHKYYQKNGYTGVYLPVAEDIAAREVSLPIYPGLTDEDVRYIVSTLTNIASGMETA